VELLHFSHFHHVSLVQWTNRLLLATGGSSLRPGGATHTLELCLATVVTPTWSLITGYDRSPLLAVFAETLATHLVQFHSHCRSQIMVTYCQDPVKPIPVPVGEPCGAPAFLTLWPCLTGPVDWPFASATGGSGSRPGGATHSLKLGLPVRVISLKD
jgi:hypothetical protein